MKRTSRWWSALTVLGWILWLTQQEIPSNSDRRWNQLGWFTAQEPCEKFGQNLAGQLGQLQPMRGYTRGTGWMAMIDTRQDAKGPRELYTVLYCMEDTVEPPKGP